MRTRHLNVAAALAILAALTIPLSASALPLLPAVSGSLVGPSYDVAITFTNETDPLDQLDIVEIRLDGTTADAYPLIWDFAGFPDNPPGAMTGFAGEGTSLVTMPISDVLGHATPGFNGGETLRLLGVDADGLPPGGPIVPVEDFIGVKVTFTFQDRSVSGILAPEPIEVERYFVADPSDSSRLILTVVPEPSTAAMLFLGLMGLAASSRRRS